MGSEGIVDSSRNVLVCGEGIANLGFQDLEEGAGQFGVVGLGKLLVLGQLVIQKQIGLESIQISTYLKLHLVEGFVHPKISIKGLIHWFHVEHRKQAVDPNEVNPSDNESQVEATALDCTAHC